MALSRTKDGQGNAIDPAGLYVCIESFGTDHELGGCAQGTRLRGNSAKVQRWPFYFVSDGADDVEVFRARHKLDNNSEV